MNANKTRMPGQTARLSQDQGPSARAGESREKRLTSVIMLVLHTSSGRNFSLVPQENEHIAVLVENVSAVRYQRR